MCTVCLLILWSPSSVQLFRVHTHIHTHTHSHAHRHTFSDSLSRVSLCSSAQGPRVHSPYLKGLSHQSQALPGSMRPTPFSLCRIKQSAHCCKPVVLQTLSDHHRAPQKKMFPSAPLNPLLWRDLRHEHEHGRALCCHVAARQPCRAGGLQLPCVRGSRWLGS